MILSAEWVAVIIAAIALVSGGAFWVITIANKPLTDAIRGLTDSIEKIVRTIEKLEESFIQLDKRLVKVETTHENNGCSKA